MFPHTLVVEPSPDVYRTWVLRCNCVRILRERRTPSQDDIKKRTGLVRCYIARVDNGHTVSVCDNSLSRAPAAKAALIFQRLTKLDVLTHTHTVHAVETLEKFASALEVPVY